jgi:glycosyltransferase involved in cell wall biosynthesis
MGVISRICLIPYLTGVGGMVSFHAKLSSGLKIRGIDVVSDLNNRCDAVLVIGGTRRIELLWKAHRPGIPIIQRLDGMNWVHRLKRTGLRHYLRAEYGNNLLSFIRAKLADVVVYQSQFAQTWWEREHRATRVPSKVIYNGVDLNIYTPDGPGSPPNHIKRILLVEGSLMGGYEIGLEYAIGLTEEVARRLYSAHSRTESDSLKSVELMVVGRVSAELKAKWDKLSDISIYWAGFVSPEKIPEIDRSTHLLFSADVNAACPNTVIEALASGTPVVAYDTGALPELVIGDAGRVVPFGGNPWRLDTPDISALAQGAVDILSDPLHFRKAARARAEEAFGLDKMVAGYLDAIP